MRRLTIRSFMTPTPVVIPSDCTLQEAHRLMRARRIRHLPVVEGGALVGLVSQRDLYLLETLKGVDPAAERVSEAMSPEPFAVAPAAPLDEVAGRMAERRLGSAVVVEGGAIIGVFTTVDALRALAEVASPAARAAGPARAGKPGGRRPGKTRGRAAGRARD